MALQGLASLFGAALAPLASDGVLHKTSTADNGTGGFTVSTVDVPMRLVVDDASDKARAASGLPADAVSLTVFGAGLSVAVDDAITIGGMTYRVTAVTAGPAGVSTGVIAVPA